MLSSKALNGENNKIRQRSRMLRKPEVVSKPNNSCYMIWN